MRIVIDMQGAQTESRFRGIGRYINELLSSLLKNKGEHEIILIYNEVLKQLNGDFISNFKDCLPDKVLWFSVINVANEELKKRKLIKKINSLLLEYFILFLKPDFVIVTSLFENDERVVSYVSSVEIKNKLTIILYDLIPFLFQDQYLHNADVKNDYFEKLNILKDVFLIFSISENTRLDAIRYLNIENKKIINISGGTVSKFVTKLFVAELSDKIETKFLIMKSKYKLPDKFLLYVGAVDFRKNINRLIEAYAILPKEIKRDYKLLLVGKKTKDELKDLKKIIKKLGVNKNVIILNYLSDEELFVLYKKAALFIFPSIYEGFGLPVLEAMCLGVQTIASKTSSIPEITDNDEMLFNPYDPEEMANFIKKFLKDAELRNRIVEHGKKRAKNFSWDLSAIKIIKTLEKHYDKNQDLLYEKFLFSNFVSYFTESELKELYNDDVLIRKIALCLEKNIHNV